MLAETLELISGSMDKLNIPYEFMEWTGEDLPSPFFIGEYQESEPLNEDGQQESMFILTGFSRKSQLELEDAKKKIKSCFPKIGGKTAMTASGAAVAVYYANSLPIPVENNEFKKIQINLTVKEWSVD